MVEKGELTVPGIDFELDKLHEECGVFGIYSQIGRASCRERV